MNKPNGENVINKKKELIKRWKSIKKYNLKESPFGLDLKGFNDFRGIRFLNSKSLNENITK